MIKNSSKPPRAWYALRRTLPPWSFEENLKELIEYLPRYGIDEVIIKVDTEEFSHGQPPLEWVQAYQPGLVRIHEEMDKLGIVFSINPWITVGHNDRGRDSRGWLPGLLTTVGHDGTECKVCACPLSEVWREHVAQVWRLYAETGPHVIWVEDDIRTFNHRPVTYGCFCAEHLRRFGERIGEGVSHEQLVSAIVRPGEPHPWRQEYLDMQGEVMIDTVDFLRRCVQDVDPSICIGLMSSGPRAHCLEGRDWPRLARAMAGDNALYSRPPMGNYHEASLRGFYYSHDSIKITRHCLPPGTLEQTEVENVPFTQYANSAMFTFLEMAISFAYGSHGVTMNLFDHCGTPMEAESAFGNMLAAKKPFLAGLAAKAQAPGEYRGVRLLHHGRSSYSKRLEPGAPYHALMEAGAAMMQALESHGIPTVYDDAAAAATSGQAIRAYTDEEIRALLSQGLLLDGVAAAVLVERGFGEHIGLRSIDAPRCLDEFGGFSAEEYFNEDFGGADKKYLTVTVPNLGGRPRLCRAATGEGAQVISRLADPEGDRHDVFMFAFENSLGGRVAVMCYDLEQAFGVPWCHPFRRELLQNVVRWLSREQPPLLVNGGVYPLACRKDCGGTTLLGLFNLTLDDWPHVEFELADDREPARVEVLSPEGEWRKAQIGIDTAGPTVRFRVGAPVPHSQPLFLNVLWA